MFEMDSNIVTRIVAPSATGYLLVILTYLIKYCPPISWVLAKTAGLFSLRNLPKPMLDLNPVNTPQPPEGYARWYKEENGSSVSIEEIFKQSSLQRPENGNAYFVAFHTAFLQKSSTPVQASMALLSKLGLNPTQSSSEQDKRGYFASVIPADVMRQAEESAGRYAANAPLSPLDGIPVVLKNEMDIQNHETRAGSSFINAGNHAKRDCAIAKQLKDLGMIVVGATNLTEVGWSTIDIRFSNPWKQNHSCGGSSSGTAAAVAAGYAPFGIGSDAGGSVRIPAAMCGIFGLKPTNGRVSARGLYISAPSVSTAGPLGRTADDMTVGYLAMADHSIREVVRVPREYFGLSVSGLRVGVIRDYNAQVLNPAITASLSRVKSELVKQGATIVPISFPYLELVRQAHLLTVSSEMFSSITSEPNNHKMQNSTSILCSVMRHLSVKDYIHAQKVRSHAIHTLANLFANDGIDLILSPTAAVTSPPFPRITWAGISDNTLVTDMMRFSFLANLAGTPAITCPVGLDAAGLPVAVQFMGEWWSEGRLCAIAKWIERTMGQQAVNATEWDGLQF
ncbi:amidase signature domain-containing protein [Chytriomyces sp. MP71]|nr:amidase signature domain-containing protein [Chytriomyces sp. MP71]